MTYEITWASPDDDEGLRGLLRHTPMKGHISVAFAREPHYFHGSRVEGDATHVICAKHQAQVVACGSLSEFDAYVGGEPATIGYLSQLRVQQGHRAQLGLIKQGYRQIRERAEHLPFSLTTIIEDNERALRFLTSGRFGLPPYHFVRRFVTLSLPFGKKVRAKPPGFRQATEADRERIVAFLNREGAEKQFFPVYTVENLACEQRSRNLSWHDFFLLEEESGDLAAVGALWDQTSYKQTIIAGYSGVMRLTRPLYNLAAPALGYPRLPKTGDHFRYLTLSHVAVRGNDPARFADFFAGVYAECRQRRRYDYLLAGFAEHDPLLQPLLAYRHIPYKSLLYLVRWGDRPSEESGPVLDDRIPYLEIARI